MSCNTVLSSSDQCRRMKRSSKSINSNRNMNKRIRRRDTSSVSVFDIMGATTPMLLVVLQLLSTLTKAAAAAAAATTSERSVLQTSTMRQLEEEPVMTGGCSATSLDPGQQRGQGSYLCYPRFNPIYKFGIDSSNQLSYYVNDVRIWSATPPANTETTECIVFGQCISPALHFFRLQNGGSLAGYDENRAKEWDSHLHQGEYTVYAKMDLGMGGSKNTVMGKRSGSVLELNEEGVMIYASDDSGTGEKVVTWKIEAPADPSVIGGPGNLVVESTESPTPGPTPGPTTAEPTSKPTVKPTTNAPTKQPTPSPIQPQQLGSIEGFVWDDTSTKDSLYNAGDVGLDSILISLHSCLDDADVIQSTTTDSDGTFELNDLEDGSYKVQITPPNVSGSSALFDNHSPTWKFVTKNVNDNASPGTVIAEDSDVNADGTSDCIVIGPDDSVGDAKLSHFVYAGLSKESDDEEGINIVDEDEISVGGTIFWDANGDGMLDESETNNPQAVRNVVVDLYDCATDQWMMLTRTDSAGQYEFTTPNPNSNTVSNDLTPLLERKGVTQFRVEVSRPFSLTEKYAFVPMTEDSHVDPDNGHSPCWDVDVDGKGSIVWNAGLTTAVDNKLPSTPLPTTSKPTMKPTGSSGGFAPATPQPTVTSVTSGGGFIGGYAFLDKDDNGVRNPNAALEPSVPNVNVRLFSCTPVEDINSESSNAEAFFSSNGDGASQSDSITSDRLLGVTKTDTQGLYNFRNLFAGYYRVKIQPPAGYRVSSAWSHGDGGPNGGDNTAVENAIDAETLGTECFRLNGGTTDISWNIGLVESGSIITVPTTSPTTSKSSAPVSSTVIISGIVFKDDDNNGYLNDDEKPLPDVQAALFDCDGRIFLISTTDANGMYGFDTVTPGSYVVKFSEPGGYKLSDVWVGAKDEEGKLIAEDSNNHADPDKGSTACREYKAGDAEYSLDAGMAPLSQPLQPVENTTATTFPTPSPTAKVTIDPKGDGTPCSGGPCEEEGLCRNKAGLCGSGIPYCNGNSAWRPDCPEKEIEEQSLGNLETPSTTAPSHAPSVSFKPSMSVAPTVAPTLSVRPTVSNAPTFAPSTGVVVGSTVENICNPDGSIGVTIYSTTDAGTNEDSEDEVQSTVIPFKYALKTTNGEPPNANLVAKFEQELNNRLGCVYFDNNPCLSCNNNGGNDEGRERKMSSLRGGRQLQSNDSSVEGLSSLPKDMPSPVEPCYGTQTFTGDCRVIDGQFTAYFPSGASSEDVAQESAKMLEAVENELAKDDWPEGMQVSYNNGPFPPSLDAVNGAERSGENENNSGGLSAGAIAGIAVGIIALVAVVAVSSILFIRRRREKDDQILFGSQQSGGGVERAVPFGADMTNQDFESKDGADDDQSENSDSDSSSDYSDSSSSSDDDDTDTDVGSRSIGSPTAVSGDTGAAYARPQDLDDDGDDETTDSSDGEDESLDSDLEPRDDHRMQQQHQAPPVYDEHGVGAPPDGGAYAAAGDYDNDQGYNDHGGNYGMQVDQQGDYNDEQQYDNGRDNIYNHQEYMNSNEEDDEIDSVTSGDPPGTSYRDLPQEDEWIDHNGMMMMMDRVPHTDPQYMHEQQAQQAQHHQQHPQMMMRNDMDQDQSGDRGEFIEGYFDEGARQGSFKVYESGESTGSGGLGLHDSHQSLGHDTVDHDSSYRSNQGSVHSHHTQQNVFEAFDGSHKSGVDGSHHSIHSSNRSFRSQGSRHSGHSLRSSARSQGSHHSTHSNFSAHSQEDNNDEGQQGYENQQDYEPHDYNQYAQDEGNNKNFNEQNYNNNGQDYNENFNDQEYAGNDQEYVEEDNYDVDRDSQYDQQHNNNYDQYHMDESDNAGHDDYVDSGNHSMAMQGQHQFGDDGMFEDNNQQYNSTLPSENHYYQGGGSPYHQYSNHHGARAGGEGTNNDNSFDEEGSYHSFNPTSPNPTNPALSSSRPEELDEEVSHTGSGYSDATHQMSNMTGPASNNEQQESYGDEEESISNIFKSLSEIQTRLASKGKPVDLPEGALSQNDMAARNMARKNPGDIYAPMNYHQPLSMPVSSSGGGGDGWGKEGVVEDASVDGSQVSSFAMSAARNRHPQQGQWMEPVDED